MRPQLPRRRLEFAALAPRAEFRVGDLAAVAEGVAEMQPGARRAVEFVGRAVVAQHVAAVVGEPQRAIDRAPVEADAVPHAAREDLAPGAVGVHAQDRRIGVAGIADVAGRADRHVKLAVGAEGDELPAVVGVASAGCR
jgi:hypothetical protein